VCSTISSRLVDVVRGWVGERGTIPAGAAMIALALGFFAATGDALWQAFVAMGVVGVGLGLTFAAMPGLIVGAVPQHETSSAMSFYQVTRYVGFSIGAGLAVTLLRAFDAGAETPSPDAYTKVFAVGAALCVLAAIVAYVLPGDAPLDRDHEREAEEGELAGAGL
jgi:MFS family permease